ncbi:hypothetical protein D2V93_14765 [Flagellimonas taeanensis]|nr:hypothetical protein D2V93_14765 [Allomuricauda taeanensis]
MVRDQMPLSLILFHGGRKPAPDQFFLSFNLKSFRTKVKDNKASKSWIVQIRQKKITYKWQKGSIP